MLARNHYLLSLLFFFWGFALTAQESSLFMPKEFMEAYQSGTRSMDGTPGPDYWTNTVDYDMAVSIDPETRSIEGSGTATYFNNSPDDLTLIVVRLYYDVFRKANPRDSRVNPQDITEGVELNSLSINGEELDLDSRQIQRSGTNLYITLSEPLKSGESLTMSSSWLQYIPLTNRRTGVADSTTFFVAYWYPQIAVYDDVFGWDTENYGLRTEFYNELADFDVHITAPRSFTVWSTGRLQNAEEVLNAEVLPRYQRALASEETVNVLSEEDLTEDFEHASDTWYFKAEEVPDFAFGLSDHYHWDAAIQRVDGRNVLVGTAYPTDDAESYVELTQTQRQIMKRFSEDMPGIPYPFASFTTFIGLGGGGMEFPMMAYNGNENIGLTAHEMYHMYFPMYVQTNERFYAWMDEGWADFMDTYIVDRYFSEGEEFRLMFTKYKTSLQGMMGSYEDLPLMTSSQYMDGGNYGYASYPLPGFLYSVLQQHLGEETFKAAYQEYIRRWAQKHPTPYDFFYTFEDVSGEDLSWFWTPWFFERGYADLKIEKIKRGKLTLRNAGSRPVPVQVIVTYQDDSTEELIASAAVWKDSDIYSTKIPDYKNMKNLSINRSVADYKQLDNFYPSLQERMEGFDVPESITGTYFVPGYGINAVVTMDEGLIRMNIPAAGMSSIVMPNEDGKLRSLDDNMILAPQEEDGKIRTLQVTLKQYGITLDAQKQ